MLVIIPHPTQELLLVKLTKQLIAENFSNNLLLYRTIPLQIQLQISDFNNKSEAQDFKETKNILKTAADALEQITILSPSLYKNGIFCQVKIQLNNKTFETELKLAGIYNKNQENLQTKNTENTTHEGNALKTFKNNLFPLELNIFRIGNSVQASENAKALSASVWKKIQKSQGHT